MRLVPAAIQVSIAVLALAGSAAAQGTVYEFTTDSRYDTGCLEPSPCDCLPQVVGPMIGGFKLVPILPQVGNIQEFAIVDFIAFINPFVSDPVPILGNGFYTVDPDAGTQEVFLGVVVGELPATFITSFGPVPLAPGFPGVIEVDIFEPVVECVIDGMRIRAAITPEFIRGDPNGDSTIDIGDPITILGYLFPGDDVFIHCLDAADANDDGEVDLADPITLLFGLFSSGGPPPPPFPSCGQDPSFDTTPCTSHPGCP